MPRIATGSRLATTRATRTRSPTTTRTSNTGTARSIQGRNVLFDEEQWVCLEAKNEHGFDLVTQQNGHYVSITDNAKMLMQAFKWHLMRDGLLKTGRTTRIIGRGRPRSNMATGASSTSADNAGSAPIATPRATARSRARVNRVSRLSGSNNSGGDQTGNT